MHMIVTCPQCSTDFPVDPEKVPDSGVLARCSICPEVFRVDEQTLVSAAVPDLAVPTVEFDAMESVVDMEVPRDVNTNEFGERELTFDVISDEGAVDADEAVEADAAVELDESPETIHVDDGFGLPVEGAVGGFEVLPADPVEPEPTPEPEPDPAPAEVEEPTPAPSGGTNPFGQRSPADRARSLARSLVSDITAYHAEKHTLALATGNLKEKFAEEVEKSWKEYCDQVPREVVEAESFFNDALNDILAQGAHLFDHDG